MTVTNFLAETCSCWWAGPGSAILKAEIRPGHGVLVHLGRIRRKNDGRWDWLYVHDRNGLFAPPAAPTKRQGTVATKDEAIRAVETIWGCRRASQ